MTKEWFRGRTYRHFDVPVGERFASKVTVPAFVSSHPFSPLISYVKSERRYRPVLGKTEFKDRTIMFASHRDACILSYYSWQLSRLLESRYAHLGIADNVIAYRRLGKANYHFAADALRFAQEHLPVKMLAFDISGFFDNLDHRLLKTRLQDVLGVRELTPDWYAVFRHVTRFDRVERKTLEEHPVFGPRFENRKSGPVATLGELKAASIPICRNPNKFGIPQGTPISSTLANLYMVDFDCKLADFCNDIGALYRRYSDDVLLICKPDHAAGVEAFVEDAVRAERLELQAKKTERTLLTVSGLERGQYLGFTIGPEGAVLRPSSLGRQWRKLKRASRRIKKAGEEAIAAGRATKIFTRKLRRRFSPVSGQVRNFSSYARRSAGVLGSKRIIRQAKRLERRLDELIKDFT